VVTAYAEIAARPGGSTLAGALAGATVLPGLHTIAGAASNTGTVTLDGGGDPAAVFVFQVDGALAFAAASRVVLANGAQASRVFWQVNGAGSVGAGSDFAGTLITTGAIAMGNGTLVNGRALARTGAVTLDNNQFYSAPPKVTITGGATAYTTDTTPTISGTTDLEEPGTVSVSIAGQSLSAAPEQGNWSVTSGLVPNDTYSVVATVSDAAGNEGTVSQQLTVDTVPPGITIDHGEIRTTNESSPTIGGSSDAEPGTVVRVTVSSQVLNGLVQADGSWSVRVASLTDGLHPVTASVSDPAGNESSKVQNLTVDTVAPVLTVSGGPDALTNDPTPTIAGASDLPAGSSVSVGVANESLNSSVNVDGAWSVTTATLPDGPHRVTVSASDPAGNQGFASQLLSVDTVAPVVTIDGGANASTSRVDPTITGTSNTEPGTTVAVSLAGRTVTTLLQENRHWNVSAGNIGDGRWPVVASVEDPAGNVGSFRQTLTIGADQYRPPECSSGTIEIRGLHRNRNKGIATFGITAGGPGRIILRRSKNVRRSSKKVFSSGKGRLKVRARRQAARKLNRSGKVKFKVKMVYKPAFDCPTVTRSARIKLVKKSQG
ncbi:MAG: Ig-like domain-containing protein, partial [Solirubrobacterales bacterium]